MIFNIAIIILWIIGCIFAFADNYILTATMWALPTGIAVGDALRYIVDKDK